MKKTILFLPLLALIACGPNAAEIEAKVKADLIRQQDSIASSEKTKQDSIAAAEAANAAIAESQGNTNTSPTWKGKYVDQFGRELKVSESRADGGIDFEIDLSDENCQEGVFAGTVYLTSPTVAFGNNIIDGSVQLTLDENTITLVESNVTHGARCNAEGSYKRK